MSDLNSLMDRLHAHKIAGLKIDMSRGKPCDEQLALSWYMLRITNTHSPAGTDCWNYGPVEGLQEARELFGRYLRVPAKNVFVLGNSSLSIMRNIVAEGLRRAQGHAAKWSALGTLPAMICPVPGYDRHHDICEQYGIRMLPVKMKSDGPDMDAVERLVDDGSVVGMWCMPIYSNSSGTTYSRDVCERLAAMRARHPSFRIIWDCAYREHHLTDEPDTIPEMLGLCEKVGNPDRVFIIGSTSKMTFASGGLAMLAASEHNLAWYRQMLAIDNIGPDRLNQLRHVMFLKDMDGIRMHMAKHREIIKPKFDIVDEVLARELGGRGLATWNRPRGGYFISLYVKRHCASSIIKLAGEFGVHMTEAGAAYPYKKDPDDSHMRLAPTYVPLADLPKASEVIALCTRVIAGQ